MKLQHSLLAAALLAAVSTSAVAQSSGVVTLGGTIVPSSCTITLANGGTAEFGQVPISTL
jgi:type 1 fimbria pilin